MILKLLPLVLLPVKAAAFLAFFYAVGGAFLVLPFGG